MLINLVREKKHIWYDDNYIPSPLFIYLVLGFRGGTRQSLFNVNYFITLGSLGNRKQAHACEGEILYCIFTKYSLEEDF